MFNEPINDTVNTLTEKEILILKLIKENANITKKEMNQLSNISTSSISRIINKLKEFNMLEREGSDKKGRWIVK